MKAGASFCIRCGKEGLIVVNRHGLISVLFVIGSAKFSRPGINRMKSRKPLHYHKAKHARERKNRSDTKGNADTVQADCGWRAHERSRLESCSGFAQALGR